MIERVVHNGKDLAQIVRAGCGAEGVRFFTVPTPQAMPGATHT
jgi:hypothetical protein